MCVEPLRPRKAQCQESIVFIQQGEAEKANEDGRLPYKDKGTRVIVFADTVDAARKVAEEIAGKGVLEQQLFRWNIRRLEGRETLVRML